MTKIRYDLLSGKFVFHSHGAEDIPEIADSVATAVAAKDEAATQAGIATTKAAEAAASASGAEADAIQLLRLHDPNLVFSGFVNTSTATPAHTANKAYIATASGTIFGLAEVVKGQVIKDDGSGFSAETFVDQSKFSTDLSKIIESLKYNSIEENDRLITKINVLEPIISYTHQVSAGWSNYVYWSWAKAVNDKIADMIGIHLYSLSALTGDLRVKVFVNSILKFDLTVENADLVDSTVTGAIQYIDLGKRLVINQSDVIAVGWEMSGSEKLQLVHRTITVDASRDLGLNQYSTNRGDGTLITATTPVATPASSTFYIPFHLFSYKVEDLSNPLGYVKSSDLNGLDDLLVEDGTNIIDPTLLTASKYLESDGLLATAADSSYQVTDFIEWGSNTDFVTGKNGVLANMFRACQYNASKVFIAGTATSVNTINTVAKNVEATYFRISYRTITVNQANFGTSILEYEIFRKIIKQKKDTTPVYFMPDDNLPVKETLTAVVPNTIYTVCNDIIQTNDGFSSRNYAACLYVDHFLKLSTKKTAKFKSTGSDKLEIFSPIATDNSTYNGGVDVKTTLKTDKLIGDIVDVDLSISHISTKASLSAAQFPKILCIGDSVTAGFLSTNPLSVTTNNPSAYWSYIKKFFKLDEIDAGSGHHALLLGKHSSREFIVDGNTIKSYAEGRGGWTTRNYLYDATFGGYTNYFYDASLSPVKFSLAKYLANYKTLADDGITRLEVGTTAGSLVTDVSAYDVCTPTHVVIQLGFNDDESNYATDMALMIASIKAEFPDMIIIVSIIDAAGTYYPENYPMFDATSVNMLDDMLHSKMYNLVAAAKALENVSNKVFYCPNYFVQPTAWGVAFRNVDFPESIANSQFLFKTEHGAGNNYHPNTYAHAAWGYQLYSLIKYTLTL